MASLKEPMVTERPLTPTIQTSQPNHHSLLSYSSSIHGNAATFHGTSPKHLVVTNSNSGMVMKPSHEIHSSFTSILAGATSRAYPSAPEQVAMQHWAHFSIPTPCVMGGAKMSVASVWIRFANGSQARLRDCVLYDGERQLAAWGPHPFTSHETVATEVSGLCTLLMNQLAPTTRSVRQWRSS